MQKLTIQEIAAIIEAIEYALPRVADNGDERVLLSAKNKLREIYANL